MIEFDWTTNGIDYYKKSDFLFMSVSPKSSE